MDLLTLRNVGKEYKPGSRALEAVDLSLGEGGFTALLGPSGCGKSTLLRLIAGLEPVSSGSVEWSGGPPGKGEIGYVFQDATLLPWANARNNAALPLRLCGIPAAEIAPRVADALERVGLPEHADKYPHELSGGMRMRVSIARALVTRPRILLLDEPFAALDEITRFRLNDDLHRLWCDDGLSVLFVTHSVAEAVFLARHVMVMNRAGRIHARLDIDLPDERTPELRTAAEFAAPCRVVSRCLAEAMT